MGISAPIVGLFTQIARAGLLKDTHKVIEFGSQDFFAEPDLVRACLDAARPGAAHDEEFLAALGANKTMAGRDFYKALGIDYQCIDTDGRHGALVMDLNFDQVPAEVKESYPLVTNFGTTEHLIGQANAFKVMHDLTAPGGLMLHCVPFFGYPDHGFFEYEPNFFEALARFNSYEILGMWVSINPMPTMIPWHRDLRQHLMPSARTVICVLFRKMYSSEFMVPFQGTYEFLQNDANVCRYNYVVDGDIISGRKATYLTTKGASVERIPGRVLAKELFRRAKIRARNLIKR